MNAIIIFSLVSAIFCAPVPEELADDFLGLAWEAASTKVNEGNPGRYIVPVEVVKGSRQGTVTTLEVVYQESWCSEKNGQELEDVCESMCPVYEGGEKTTYEVIATEENNGNTFEARRIA
ncbi:unnamed protein product [Caenorhabditis auriculariae]|uniref:Cystatin domain-containing protein n=1 Tax=Caenorhabditis auriculariae TaxID=2777116 RepID=A0A8S1H2B4_9PELO|nr:unnamed protein product [Caenorhabditis auriculariae]